MIGPNAGTGGFEADGGRAAEGADETLLGGLSAVWLVAALILAVLCFQINATMITPIFPEIARAMRTDVASVSQMSSLFYLTGGVAGVVLGRWSDFLGRRRMLLSVLASLALGSLVCAFAANLTMLLVGRVLQGASGAVYPLAYLVLKESAQRSLFGLALGSLTAISGGVGGLDTLAGGLLGERFGFRAVFLVILGVTGLALVAVALVIPKAARPDSEGRMDWPGAVALSGALVSLSLFVSQGASHGWVSAPALASVIGAVVSLGLLSLVERGRASPLVALRHLKTRQPWAVMLTTILTLSGVFPVLNFTVAMLGRDQAVGFGLSAAAAAVLLLAPAAIVGVVSAPFAGWLAGRWSWFQVLRLGLGLSTALLVAIAWAPRNELVVVVATALLGFTYFGLALTTLNGLGVLLSPPEAPATLPGLNGAAFGIGAGLGIGLVAPFVGQGALPGYGAALWISAAISALALIASFSITPSPRPARRSP